MLPKYRVAQSGNIKVNMMHFMKAGDTEIGHVHPFDHCTLVANGSVEIEIEGRLSNFEAPHLVWIKKGVSHRLTALEDSTVCCCINAIRDECDDVIDPDMIP